MARADTLLAMGSETTLQEIGEFALIERLTGGLPEDDRVQVGPGDDAALLTAASGAVLVTCDVLVEGQHFRCDWSTAIDIGRKAAAASLADVAAMGGTATGLVVGFGAPADLASAWAVECTAGLREEAATVGASLIGGDIVQAPQIILSVTALGDLGGRTAVLRSGAQPGDVIAVAGRLGWSAAGLALLSRGFRSPKVLVDAHRFPEPPYAAGPLAADAGATAMVDVSDGLVADARHVAEASGVVLRLTTENWEIPEPMQAAASAYNTDALEWMLTGGEDHALLATFPANTALPEGFRVVGSVEEGDPAVLVNGVVREKDGGFRHFT